MSENKQKSIVIVDDTPENLQLLMEMLSKQGYRVRPAPNGELALASIQKEAPDLILLDIIMPDMDGFEVCRRLKANDQVHDIPVIFISALNEVFDKVTAFASGGVDYITKPLQVEEVLARVRTHLNLREMRQNLEEERQELEAFAHTVAHDLKNPLGTLIGLLELIKSEADESDESSLNLLDLGMSSAYKLHSIVDELLLLASVRKEKVVMMSVNMGEAVEQAFRRLEGMVNEYQPEVIVQDSWPAVMGYGPWIEEVWVNYLSNALKYGGNPPRLQLGADSDYQGMIRFWVKDNGAGLEMADQSALFTEFTRLDKLRAQGHGLGLSIVRRIVDKLGGYVGVESAPNEGSLFYFMLPIIPES